MYARASDEQAHTHCTKPTTHPDIQYIAKIRAELTPQQERALKKAERQQQHAW
jgi:hypothetical protein